MALSVLTALSDSESRFFAPNFWNTQGTTNTKKDQQREVLKMVETARYQNHASQQAHPIRYCYVAWSIIKLDGKILFYQREDTQKRHDKSAGDYGLVGGRANQQDIPSADKAALLKELQTPDSALIKNALPETLKRELEEEAGLDFETHYTFKPWRSLKPYRQVQGAAPNHALTEYYLEIFQIDLNLPGALFLLKKIKTDERLIWFSIAEMVKNETADGKGAFLNALYADFNDDRSALADVLTALPDSFTPHYLLQQTKYGLTLPVDHNKPLFAGGLGKEKPLAINFTDRQLALLLGLASHLRGFDFATVDKAITLHPFGWIEVNNHSTFQAELISLADSLKQIKLIIENDRDLFFRLSMSPEMVYFDEKLFSLTVKEADLNGEQSKIPVTIQRDSFDTAFGQVKAKTEEFKLTLYFVKKLKKLDAILVTRSIFTELNAENTDTNFAEKIEDAYKKGLHKEPRFLALGLKGLIRREAGIFKFFGSSDFGVIT